jgi:DNA invertase Pin-like site-specific DNA recombinase
VSTADQTVENQLIPLRQYSERHGWEIAGEFSDVISGATVKRPGLDACKEALRPGDVLLVSRIDRLMRSMVDFHNLLQELDDRDIRLIAIDQGIDTDKRNPTSNLLIRIVAAIAEWERDVIRERVRDGIRRYRAHGGKMGRPSRLIDMKRLEQLLAEGKALREAADILGVSAATLSRRLRRQKSAVS